jgi:hypothetical protein
MNSPPRENSILAGLRNAQNPASGAPPGDSVIPVQAPEDKRIFGVLPNNRTTENSIPFHLITPRQKVMIAAKDSFDSVVFAIAPSGRR